MSFDTLDMERLRGLAGNKWQLYGEDVLPAWVADMDFQAAAPIRDYVARAGATGDFGYPLRADREPLPEVFAERARTRYGWQVDPGRVELIIDVVQGLYLGLHVYCRSDEAAIIQTPIYPNFLNAANEVGRRALQNALVPGAYGFELDLDGLRGMIDGKTRVLMLCNPHNPTGRVFQRQELEAIAEIALAHDLVVLADEIFSDVLYDGRRHIPFATLGPEIEARTVTLNSASKAFNLGGLRCAVAIFGSDALQERFKSVPNRLLGGHNCFGAAVTRIAWQQCDDWLAELVDYLQENRDFVTKFLSEHLPDIRYLPPESAIFAWLNCAELDLPGGPYEYFLERAKVALSDGVPFGDVGQGCVRLNFATPRKLLQEILERMADSLQ